MVAQSLGGGGAGVHEKETHFHESRIRSMNLFLLFDSCKTHMCRVIGPKAKFFHNGKRAHLHGTLDLKLQMWRCLVEKSGFVKPADEVVFSLCVSGKQVGTSGMALHLVSQARADDHTDGDSRCMRTRSIPDTLNQSV